jgi:hypothetical protein
LPLCVKNHQEVAEACHTTQGGNHKKKPAYETLESFMRWLCSQQDFVVDS